MKRMLHIVKRILCMWIVNHILAGTHAFVLKRKLLCSLGHIIGRGTKIVGPLVCTGKLSVGANCWVGRNLTVHGNGTVTIGDNCDIAPDVTFLTGGHQIGSSFRRAGTGEHYQISVGHGTWIGARSTIGRSVQIGEGCVVAACACVMQDIENNHLVGGTPAKTIRVLE